MVSQIIASLFNTKVKIEFNNNKLSHLSILATLAPL